MATPLKDHITADTGSGLAAMMTESQCAVGMFAAWPWCSFVERHGVDHPAESLAAMAKLTKRWSCEFAIRPFLNLSATIRSTSTDSQHLVVDYIIHHPTATGATSTKVFKWTNLRLDPGQTISIDKRRAIKAISTRTYQPGPHLVDLQVAGQVLAGTQFDLGL